MIWMICTILTMNCFSKVQNRKKIFGLPTKKKKIEEYARFGGKLFLHHDGHCYYNENGAITKPAKATHKGHPDRVEIEIYPTGDLAELTAGIEPFRIEDEEFLMEIQDSKTIYLKSHSKENGTSNQGWAHDYGKGKVVVFVLGHYIGGLEHKMVRKLISNAINYLLS